MARRNWRTPNYWTVQLLWVEHCFTQDEDLLAEGVRRQRAGEPLPGIIYAHQLRVTIGQ